MQFRNDKMGPELLLPGLDTASAQRRGCDINTSGTDSSGLAAYHRAARSHHMQEQSLASSAYAVLCCATAKTSLLTPQHPLHSKQPHSVCPLGLRIICKWELETTSKDSCTCASHEPCLRKPQYPATSNPNPHTQGIGSPTLHSPNLHLPTPSPLPG